jgi:hypothetical protein
MNYFIFILQIVVGLSILNVWILQKEKPTKWRGGNATTILEEFQVYGLPVWMCYVIGALKVTLAIALLAAIWFPELKQPASLGTTVRICTNAF